MLLIFELFWIEFTYEVIPVLLELLRKNPQESTMTMSLFMITKGAEQTWYIRTTSKKSRLPKYRTSLFMHFVFPSVSSIENTCAKAHTSTQRTAASSPSSSGYSKELESWIIRSKRAPNPDPFSYESIYDRVQSGVLRTQLKGGEADGEHNNRISFSENRDGGTVSQVKQT
jgi:hypothetical protein